MLTHMIIDIIATNIHYDGRSKTWFNQSATAENDNFPPPRRYGCTFALEAADKSSFYVLLYGGEPEEDDQNLDDLYVLALPAFHWISLGSTGVRRAKHACAKLGNRYMLTYGGMARRDADWYPGWVKEGCDQEEAGIRLMDLTTLEWTSKYEVQGTDSTFRVPKAVSDVVGGGEDGGATLQAPSNGFDNPDLRAVFQRLAATTATESDDSMSSSSPVPADPVSDGSSGDGGGSNAWIAGPVVGAIAGIGIIALLIVLYRHRQRATVAPVEVAAGEKRPFNTNMSELGGGEKRSFNANMSELDLKSSVVYELDSGRVVEIDGRPVQGRSF